MNRLVSSLLLLCLIVSVSAASASHSRSNRKTPTAKPKPNAPDVTITIDAQSPVGHAISPTLYGIFFEEINHAGYGGLDAQLLNHPTFVSGNQKTDPWTTTGLTTAYDATYPLGALGEALHVQGSGSLNNAGFWGVPIEPSVSYNLTCFVLVPAGGALGGLTAQLKSAAGVVVASAAIPAVAADGKWHAVSVIISVSASIAADYSGSFSFAATNANFYLQLVTLYPSNAGYAGLPFLRTDVAEYIAALKPSFMRFPGGCFVEGDILADAFRWKKTIGPKETRSGHWDLWNYWTPDHLGYLEFLQFGEAIGAAPLFVVNNGISHQESVPPTNLTEWIQDALDAVEFANGNTSTKYGALRAQYGHPAPFNLKYMAIGNEDAGKEYYWQNYQAFYTALKAAYPTIQLVANDQPSRYGVPASQAQLWDYHTYTSQAGMFGLAHTFDSYNRSETPIFVSEYAVTTGSGKTGNFYAALAEAAFLTGCERNSDVVKMVSYAPLLVNNGDRYWSPDAIVYNNHEIYGTPSYWLQTFFGNGYTGDDVLPYTATVTTPSALSFYSSVTGPNLAHGPGLLVLKLVANSTVSTTASITINVKIGLPLSVPLPPYAKKVTMSAPLGSENSFEAPETVVPVEDDQYPLTKLSDGSFNVVVPGASVTTLVLDLTMAMP